jgi:hypothetical protein
LPPVGIDFTRKFHEHSGGDQTRREKEKKLGKLQHQLGGIQAAAKAQGHSTEREVLGAKKRVLSAAGRAAIIKDKEAVGEGEGASPKRGVAPPNISLCPAFSIMR